MGESVCDLLLKILLTWLFIVTLTQAALVKSDSSFQLNEDKKPDKIYVKPSDLVVREASGRPLIYQFIIDYPHPPVPGNNYYKPWNTVSSNPITVKNTEYGHSRILKKKNILYLSKAEVDTTESQK